ncbi:MAG: aldolase/citrate lyase family protein [Candidatus Falkowbacteria bacterium]|nr:aldolase/citrate lyase family protein [Candidatus Falkowbacteria bacterium]
MDNSKRVKSYLFVPASQEKSLAKSKELVGNGDTIRIIDFEDSIKDATDVNRSAELKRQARKTMQEYILSDNEPFCLRINDLRSSFWEEDVELLSDLKEKINFNSLCEGIVLSKTDSLEEVKSLLSILEERGIDVPIIPLIETIKGMENLSEIISESKVKSVVFGHHDYFYEKDIFPIPSTALTSEVYRNTLGNIISTLKGSGVGLIDGICPNLYDKEIEQDCCRYLYQQAPELSLGKLTLNPQQVAAICTTDNWNKELELTSEDDEASPSRKKEIARGIIKSYENRLTSNLGVGRSGEMYLSPQQYYLALDALDENNERNKPFKDLKIR